MFSSQWHHLHGQEVLKFILGCCHANFFLFSLSLNGSPTDEKSIEIEISRICSHNSEGTFYVYASAWSNIYYEHWIWNKTYCHFRPTCTTDVVSYQHQCALWRSLSMNILSRLTERTRHAHNNGRSNLNTLRNQQIYIYLFHLIAA